MESFPCLLCGLWSAKRPCPNCLRIVEGDEEYLNALIRGEEEERLKWLKKEREVCEKCHVEVDPSTGDCGCE